jgi:hypothetical protein
LTFWYEKEGAARLEHDREIVAEGQRDLKYVTNPDGSLSLEGHVSFALRSGIPQRIATRIDFPPDYPKHEPQAVDSAGRFPWDADHHMYTNGRVCLWLDVETGWRANDFDALRMFLEQLQVHYFRLLTMEADPSRTFPGRTRGHGGNGYLEHLEERLRLPGTHLKRMIPALVGSTHRNAPCPCGSRVRYRNCHRRTIRPFRSRLAPANWDLVLSAVNDAGISERGRTEATRSV